VEISANSVEQTRQLGQKIGQLAKPGQCIALDGPLGAGKTQLVGGLAMGAMAANPSAVNSPTYVLLNIYEPSPKNGAKIIFHLDAYRVRDAAQFAAVGFDELLQQGGIVVLEWATRVPDLLPEDHLQITGEIIDENSRLWSLAARGPVSTELLNKLLNTT